MDPLVDIVRKFREQIQLTQLDDSPAQRVERSVWTAVDTRRMHLNRIAHGEEEPMPNPELVELWRDAALQIASFKPDLANLLRIKSEYWSYPTNWTPREISEDSIRIEAISLEAGQLLHLLRAPQNEVDQRMSHDFFISHASSDKESVARPLANGLLSRRVTTNDN